MINLSKKIFLCGIVTIIASFVSAQSESNNSFLDMKSKEWKIERMDLEIALAKIASDIDEITSGSTIILYEGWDDTWMNDVDSNLGISMMRVNPNLRRFSLDTHGKTVRQVLDDIAEKHGAVSWWYNEKEDIVHVVMNPLMNNGKWTQNARIGAVGNDPLTFKQALNALEKFGYDMEISSAYLLKNHKNPDAIAWKSGFSNENTVRSLFASIVRSFRSNGNRRAEWYQVFPLAGFDPRKDDAALANAAGGSWGVYIKAALSKSKAEESVKLMDKCVEEGKKPLKEVYPKEFQDRSSGLFRAKE